MGLAARHLEANGIATVIIGSAMDIIVHCGVPRYLHTDLPLGNPCGKPYDAAMQSAIVRQALNLVVAASNPQTIERAPFTWGDDNSWRDRYLRVDDSNRQQLAALGEQRRQLQLTRKARGELRSPMLSED